MDVIILEIQEEKFMQMEQQLIIDALITCVKNFIFFNFIPLIWWLCRHRKESGYFAWLGFKKPKMVSKWWIAVSVAISYVIFQNIDFTVLLPAADLETMNGSENVAASVYTGIGLLSFIPALLENYIANGLCEEIFFRGFITKRFKSHFGTVKGVLIGATTFALMHNILYIVASLLGQLDVSIIFHIVMFSFTFIAGVFMGSINEKIFNGSIWASILLHGSVNFINTMLLAFSIY